MQRRETRWFRCGYWHDNAAAGASELCAVVCGLDPEFLHSIGRELHYLV